jgi:WD40 repeat protein
MRRRVLLVLGLLGLLGSIGIVWWLLRTPSPTAPEGPVTLDSLTESDTLLPDARPWYPPELVEVLSVRSDFRSSSEPFGVPQVSYAATSPDGRWIATSDDGIWGDIYLWDPKTLRAAAVLRTDRLLPWRYKLIGTPVHLGPRPLAFSPDGKLLAAGGPGDERFQLWDLSREPYRLRATVLGLASPVKNLLFLSDGKLLLALDMAGTLRAWTGLEGQPAEAPVPVKLAGVSVMACAADGQALALGDKTGHLHYYRIEGGQWVEKADLQLPLPPNYATGVVYAIAFAPDGLSFAASGIGVSVWSTVAMPPRLLTQLEAHTENDHGLFFSRDGRQLVTVAGSGGPHVWQRDGDRFTKRFLDPKSFGAVRGYSHAAALTPDGETLVVDSGLLEKQLVAWDIRGSRPVQRADLYHNCYAVQGVRFSPDGRSLFVTEPAMVRRWDLTQGKGLGRKAFYIKKPDLYYGSVVSPDCGSVVGRVDGSWVLFEIDGDVEKKTRVAPLAFWAPVFSPDSRFLASGYAFRDLTPGKKMVLFGDCNVSALAFAPDSKTLATLAFRNLPEGTVQLWECGDGEPQLLRSWKVDPPNPSCAAFGPKGQSLVLAGEDGVVHSWDLTQDPPRSTAFVKKHTAAIEAVAFAPGETKFATAGDDGRVVVWTPQGEVLKEWQLSGPIFDVTFAPDGRHLATLNGEGTVFVLRLP